MLKLLQYMVVALGLSTVLAAGYEGYYTSSFAAWLVSGTGCLLMVLAVVTARFENKGIFLVAIIGSTSLLIQAWFVSTALSWLVLTTGILAIVAFLATMRLRPVAKSIILHAQDGATLMEVRKFEFKEGNLVIRGKMMGTMPTVAQMRPEEVWKTLTMIPTGVLLGFPAYLLRAWKTNGKPSKQAKSALQGY